MLYLVYGVDKAGGEDIYASSRPGHVEYVKRHKDIVVLGGATLADDNETRTGNVCIINVADRKAADEFSLNDPFHKVGLYETVTVTRMRRGRWNPDAALDDV
jgi:uncharacterized protein YciI